MKTKTPIAIISLFLLVLWIGIPAQAVENPPAGNSKCTTGKISISGETPDTGILDPSLEYDDSTGILWMSYSRVRTSNICVDTHIASSSDNGASWTYRVEVNRSENTGGKWQHETPSLVYDPTDPNPKKRWKLYWFEYLTDHMGTDSWIAHRSAPDPTGPWSSREILFASKGLAPKYTPQVTVNKLDLEIADSIVLGEPGALVDNGIIYVAVGDVFRPTFPHIRVFMLKSTDHGANWRYAGMIATPTDAAGIGDKEYHAVSLCRSGSDVYALLSPVVTVSSWTEYRGVKVFRFDDLANSRLERDRQGKLIPLNYVQGLPENIPDNGAGTYEPENQAGGMLIGQKHVNPLSWDIVRTCESVIPKTSVRQAENKGASED